MNINNNKVSTPELELIRTDSTTLSSLYHKKNTIGNIITPLGRERAIKRLNTKFIDEYKYYISTI
tara:strand:+ start:250 stop:444 length:195 start_codon:yes stop_codon:yes gene_type:complete